MRKIYDIGDLSLVYGLGDCPTWILLPADMKGQAVEKGCLPEPLVQVKLMGDDCPSRFLNGCSMKYSQSVQELSFEKQESRTADGRLTVETVLADRRGYRYRHIASSDGTTVRVRTVFENQSPDPVSLEMLSSFTLGGLTPFVEGEATGGMVLHRMQSFWSAEGRLESGPVEGYQLEPSWSDYGGRNLRYGQIGSMPVRGYFPFAAVEDCRAGVLWGAQLAIASSWQMELTRIDDGLSVSGGIADREFGHWVKTVRPGEAFEAPEAILSVCRGSLDDLCARLVTAQEEKETADSRELPVIFNEFCTTWGEPSLEKIEKIAGRLDGSGVRYFVIDAGWYREEGTDWGNAIGDWQYSRTFFPGGMEAASRCIREHGMIPGIWFEMEDVGSSAAAFGQTGHLLKRDGTVITTGGRRFWDMEDPWVWDYLKKRVIGFLKEGGFGYLKVDYNNSIGLGCDGAESLGESLRRKVLASQEFFREIRRELPGLVIENCSSGGHRLEPSMMRLCDMASFSDAHECIQIPVIAANVQRAIPAWKSQIWAVLRKTDSLRRLVYSLVNTFLGRMCLSGDIFDLTGEQWETVREGIAFYQKVSPIIRSGKSRRYGPPVFSYNRPEGWQAVARSFEEKTLVVFHAFGSAPPAVELPLDGMRLLDFFGENPDAVTVDREKVTVTPSGDFSACAMLLEKV